MNQDQIDSLQEGVKGVSQLLSMLRIVVALVGGCFTISGGVAVWAWSTSTAIAENRIAVAEIAKERKEATVEWQAWRRVKDDNDTKILTILEAQQRIIDRFDQRYGSR